MILDVAGFRAMRESPGRKAARLQLRNPYRNHSKHMSKPVLEEAGDVSKSYQSRIEIASKSFPNRIQIDKHTKIATE